MQKYPIFYVKSRYKITQRETCILQSHPVSQKLWASSGSHQFVFTAGCAEGRLRLKPDCRWHSHAPPHGLHRAEWAPLFSPNDTITVLNCSCKMWADGNPEPGKSARSTHLQSSSLLLWGEWCPCETGKLQVCAFLNNTSRSLAGVARLLISSTQLSASWHSQQKQLISGTNRELSHSTDVSS